MSNVRTTVGAALAAALALALGAGCSSTVRPPSNDAFLRELSVSAGELSPAFSPGMTSYALVVPAGTTTATLAATLSDSKARSLTIRQDDTAPMELASGAASPELVVPAPGAFSMVSVTIMAEDGITTGTYSVLLSQVTQHEAHLSALTLGAGVIRPGFDPETFAYGVTIPRSFASVTLTATADPTASITMSQDGGTAVPIDNGAVSPDIVLPPAGASTVVDLVVTAQDGVNFLTYTLTLTRPSTHDATLAELEDSAGGVRGFSPGTLAYSYMVPFQSGDFTVTPIPTDLEVASITVNGVAVLPGQPSQPIPLTMGTAVGIIIVVTAADGISAQTYTLSVTEARPPPVTGLVNARTVPVAPSPTLHVGAGSRLPAHGGVEVPVDTLLRIGFDAPPTVGTTGRIEIHRASDGVLVDHVDLADPWAEYDGTNFSWHLDSSKLKVLGNGADYWRLVNYRPVLVDGNTATIYPHDGVLAYGTQYYVTIEAAALAGTIGGAAFAGIAANEWTFTTKATQPATWDVATDDTSDFATVQGAIDAIPTDGTGSRPPAITVHIAPGVYQEMLFIRKRSNVRLQGTDSVNTIIQYENFDGFNGGTGNTVPAGTALTGSVKGGGRSVVLVSGTDMLTLDSITIKNTHDENMDTLLDGTVLVNETYSTGYKPGQGAEAIYFNSTPSGTTTAGRLVALHSNFVGMQSVMQLKGWSWLYDCFVTGDTDTIWGATLAAVFERCEIKTRVKDNPSIVQTRAYLNYGDSNLGPSTFATAYPGFVFLNCALTKEDGDFGAYLGRSYGKFGVSGSVAPFYYTGYDIIAYVNCTLGPHILPAGWAKSPALQFVGSAVQGFREYGSYTPEGLPVDTSLRLSTAVDSSYTGPGNSLQLGDADVATFFPDRATILSGTSDGTLSTIGYPGGWSPQP